MVIKICNKESHSAFMLENLSTRRDQFHDVNLKTGNIIIPAHKIILSAASEFFQNCFTSKLSESKNSEVDLSGLSARSVEHILQYIYSGDLACDPNILLDLYRDVDFLQIIHLKDLVYDLIIENLTVKSCLETFELFEKLKTKLEAVTDFISENLYQIILCEKFLSLPVEKFQSLLRRLINNFETKQSDDKSDRFYDAVMAWTRHDYDSRNVNLPDLLTLLNTEQFSSTLIRKLHMDSILRNDLKCTNWVLDTVVNRDKIDLKCEPEIYYLMEDGLTVVELDTETKNCRKITSNRNFGSNLKHTSIRKKVFVILRASEPSSGIGACLRFDTETAKWNSFQFQTYVDPQAVCAFKQNIYVIGKANQQYGKKLFKCSFESRSLTECASFSDAIDYCSLCHSDNNMFLTYLNQNYVYVATYSTDTNCWNKTNPANSFVLTGRFSTAYFEEKIYVINFDGKGGFFSFEKMSWTDFSAQCKNFASKRPQLAVRASKLFVMATDGAYVYENGTFNRIRKF